MIAKYRDYPPQCSDMVFVDHGGLTTALQHEYGVTFKEGEAYKLLDSCRGRTMLWEYFRGFIDLARRYSIGVILEAPTYRASLKWGAEHGYSESDLVRYNQASIEFLCELRSEYETDETPVVISGCIGPHEDAYRPDLRITARRARRYHGKQIQTFADSAADFIAATTLGSVREAIGICRAARSAKIPVVISFTLETDGRLPTGKSLKNAIRFVDTQTGGYPLYYMINCAHPSHFETMLMRAGSIWGRVRGNRWLNRIRGIRANASKKSHEQLLQFPEIDRGDSAELAASYLRLRKILKNFNILGGCCGTDVSHIEAILAACLPHPGGPDCPG